MRFTSQRTADPTRVHTNLRGVWKSSRILQEPKQIEEDKMLTSLLLLEQHVGAGPARTDAAWQGSSQRLTGQEAEAFGWEVGHPIQQIKGTNGLERFPAWHLVPAAWWGWGGRRRRAHRCSLGRSWSRSVRLTQSRFKRSWERRPRAVWGVVGLCGGPAQHHAHLRGLALPGWRRREDQSANHPPIIDDDITSAVCGCSSTMSSKCV